MAPCVAWIGNKRYTTPTEKTVWHGLTSVVDRDEITDYTYNLQGRMASAEVDSDGNGDVDTRSDYEYDASGIRVAQTVTEDSDSDGDLSDETPQRTDYHVDHHNHTGYAQVLEEMQGGAVVKSYTIGHDVFLEAVAANDARRLLKDGHGSTRALVDATGTVLSNSGEPQIYAYDAYGNPIGYTPSLALTTHLYSGEQTDQLTGLQYLRARWYDPATGRFNRLDPFAGNFSDPQSLHKYLYTHGDPVNGIDPTGQFLTVAGFQSFTSRLGPYLNQARVAFNVLQRFQATMNAVETLYSMYQHVQSAVRMFRATSAAMSSGVPMFEALRAGVSAGFGALPGVDLSSLNRAIRAMYSEFGNHWHSYSRALENAIPEIAAKLPSRVDDFLPTLNKVIQRGFGAHLVIFLPSAPLNGATPSFDVWLRRDKVEIRSDGRGGRLFGIAVAVPKGRRGTSLHIETIARIDYMKYGGGMAQLQGHYHLLGDTSKHPHDNVFWEP